MKVRHDQKARAAVLLSLCLFLSLSFLLQGCGETAKPVVVLDGETMGTYYQIKVVDPGPDVNAAALRRVTEEALADVNNKMSTYIPDSELMKLNASPTDTWVEVSDRLYAVLETSERVSKLTGGAFDITVAPLVNLWGFGPEGVTEAPDDEMLQQALARVGYQHLELQADPPQARRVRDVQLDLSAVAKGYGADYLAEIYRSMKLNDFMVEIGGELRLSGVNAMGKPWRIGVETPSMARTGVVQAVSISDAGMATSGDYRNYYEVDGNRISHTIDPATGRPITHNLASVTVVAKTAAEADALATALNVMGGERARALAEAEGIAAFFIERQNGEFVSSYSQEFKQYMP